MDALDRQIIKLMQQNCRLATEEIGHQVGLSATACQRRIKKLRESGVIKKEIAVIDGIQLGGYVTVIVEVTMKQCGATSIDMFKERMLNQPSVQQCYYVAGHIDFMLIVTATNMLEYEKLSRQLFFADNNIQKFHSIVAMNNVKVGLDIPLDVVQNNDS